MFNRLSRRISDYLYKFNNDGEYSVQLIKVTKPVWGLKAPQIYKVLRGRTPYSISRFEVGSNREIHVLERNVLLSFENGDMELIQELKVI